ncbi:MAG: hypothetical protein KKH94_10025 [Candidatus Omnitrophica bacterium]|nr:hypothetical protein [Candidatus Omnitrophota bacterium]
MSCDFDLYIWNGIILEHGPETQDYRDIVQGSEKLLKKLRKQYGLPEKEIRLEELFSYARETSRALYNFINTYCTDEYIWPTNKNYLVDDAQMLLGIRLALVDADGDITKLTEGQRAFYENYIDKNKMKDLMTVSVEQRDIIRRQIDLYMRLKFGISDMFNFKEGALTEFVTHFMAASKLHKISREDELKTLKRITKEVLRKYQENKNRYVETRFNITADSKKPFDENKQATLHEILAVIQAHKDYKIEQEQRGLGNMVPELKITLSITKFGDNEEPFGKREAHKIESAQIFVDILEEAWKLDDGHYMPITNKEGNEVLNFSTRGSEVTGQNVLQYVIGIDAAGQEEYNPPSLFYKAYQIVMAYKQKVKEMGRDGDLCIGTTSHVSESVTDVTMESGIRFALEALFMKSFEDVDDKTPIVLDRLGHAIVIAVEYDQLFGTERREHVEERLKQIAFDLNLLREGKVPLISITEAQLIQERDMLNNSLRSGALTLQSEIFLGTYTEEMIIDLYARAGYVRDILIEKGTYVETNPTSNVGISPYVSGYKDHPLAVYLKKTYGEWAEDVRQRIVELDAGKYASAIDTAQKYYNTALASDYQGQKVKVTISTDDLTLFGTTPTEELYRMATALDLSFDELFTIIEDGFKSRLGNRPFQYEQEVTEQLQQLRKSFAEKKEAAAIARKSEAMASMQPKGEFYSKQLIRKNKPADGHIVNSLSSQMTQRLTTLPVAATYYRSDARIGLSRFQIDALIKEALVRIQTDKATMPNILFIDFLDKSPEMVVDKFEDGYVGINSALNTIKNQTARAILLDVLVVRGLSRGLMGSDITDTYEREQLKRDVDFAVELLRSACKDNIIEMQRILNEIHQALSEIVEGATFIDALRIAVDTQIRSMQQEAKQADVIPFPSTKEKSLFGDLQEANITVDADEARAIINDMIEGGKLRAGEDEKALRVRDLNVQEELEVTVQENGVGTIARLIQFMMSPFGSRAKTWANRNIPPEKQEAMKIALAQTYMSNVIPLFREKIKGVLHDCGLSEREVVDAISLTKKVEIIYQKMILRDTNYHNHAHNLITVYGALNLAKERLRKTGMKPGESNYKQYMKATFMAGLMHDFHIRSKHMKSETLDRPAYVAETLRQIADLFGIKKYDYTGEEKYYDAHYTDPAFDQDKNTIKSLIKSFLGEKETKDLFPLVRTMILRTDFASDIPVPPTHKPATTKIRDEIDTMIEEQLRGTGRVDVQKVRMHVRRRYRSLITEAGRSGDQAAVNGLRRLRDIEINYARSFADLNISDHTIAHALAYRLEAADQSGFYMYLPSRMVDIAVVSGLASEVANISSWGSFAGFFKPELLTPGFLSILKEAPQDAKENLMNVITYFARNSAESAPLEFLPDGFREAVASSAQTWAEMQDGTREALGLVSPRQLQQTDLQTYFTQAEITDFASHATADTYDLETILPARVRSTNNLYVVLTGTVTTMFDGKTQYFRSGNIVGDIGVFQNLPPNATVSIASGSTIAIIPNVDPAFFRTAQPPIAAGGIRFLKTQPEEVVERATILPAMLKEYKEQFETLREVSIGSTHRHLDVYLKPFSEVIKQEGNKENPDESNLIMVLEDVRADGERSIAFGEDTYMEELLRGLGIRPVFTSNREEIATLKENGYFYVGTDSKSAVAQGAKAKVFLPVDKDKKILRQLAIVHFGLVIMALLAAPSINVDIVDLEEIFDNWTEIAEKNLTGMLDKITTAIRMHAFKVAA